ncbi:MAG: hypothetical protein P4L10_17020 [Acidobacteriaceae bacterium]|nr:hypothetical protein [Acidobacteriaceae bacterium]
MHLGDETQVLWLVPEQAELRWGRQRDPDRCVRLPLSQVRDVLYGQSQKAGLISAPSGYFVTTRSITLVCENGRAVQMCVEKGSDTKDILLGLQWLVTDSSPTCRSHLLSEGQFYYKKFQLLLDARARTAGLTYYTFLKKQVQSAIQTLLEKPQRFRASVRCAGMPQTARDCRTSNFRHASEHCLGTFANRTTSCFRLVEEAGCGESDTKKRATSFHEVAMGPKYDSNADSNKENTPHANGHKQQQQQILATMMAKDLLNVSVTNVEQSVEPISLSDHNTSSASTKMPIAGDVRQQQKPIYVPFVGNTSGIMGEQSFSLDNWSIELSKAEGEGESKVFAFSRDESEAAKKQAACEVQNTSRFRQSDPKSANPPTEIVLDEAGTGLRKQVQELRDETIDAQRQSQYWQTKLSLVTQDMGDKLAEKDREIAMLRARNTELGESLEKSLFENNGLCKQLA